MNIGIYIYIYIYIYFFLSLSLYLDFGRGKKISSLKLFSKTNPLPLYLSIHIIYIYIYIYEPFWLGHINLFIKIAVQKHSLDIHLSNLIIETGCHGQENSDGFKHCYRRESFFIVHYLFLCIAFRNKSSLKGFDFSIRPFFPLVDPFVSNWPEPFR